jgi:membrane protease YdiL (CAAX protease family)
VLVTVAASLALQDYYGDRTRFDEYFPQLAHHHYVELLAFAWWVGIRVAGFVLLPIVAIVAMPGERLRDYFLGVRGIGKHIWIYLALYALVAPAVVVASGTRSFALTYPFYKLANRSAFDFWAWEVMYALQFLALEFFFRGFMLKALRARFGYGAIFVMTVPYCMIHFGKPISETLAAIVAGTVLGTLAMRTRSIWGGVFLHVAVALTMDLLAVAHCPPPGQRCPG